MKRRFTVSFVCGDNYFNQHSEVVISEICRVLKRQIDLLVAGLAFNATATGQAAERFAPGAQRIAHSLTAYPGNPAVDMYKRCADCGHQSLRGREM